MLAFTDSDPVPKVLERWSPYLQLYPLVVDAFDQLLIFFMFQFPKWELWRKICYIITIVPGTYQMLNKW